MIHRGRLGAAVLVLATGCTTQITETITTEREVGGRRITEAPSPDAPSGIRAPAPSAGFAMRVYEGTGGASATTAVTTDKTSYVYGDPIRVTFALFPGNAFDWVSLAPQGSAAEEISWWSYTHGAHDGTIQTHPVDLLPTGTFVARGYFDDGFVLAAESAPFTVGAMPALPVTVSTDKNAYGGLETVQVTFAGLAGGDLDWIGAYVPSGSMMSYGPWRYANRLSSGTLPLPPLYAGAQEVRAFETNRFELRGRSAVFTVTPQVATDRATYGAGAAVTISFGGMAGPWSTNFVAIAESGSAPEAYVLWSSTASKAGGARTIDISGLADGSYVARAYFGDDPVAKAESAPFTIAR